VEEFGCGYATPANRNIHRDCEPAVERDDGGFRPSRCRLALQTQPGLGFQNGDYITEMHVSFVLVPFFRNELAFIALSR
jgi:hypothetical protein